MALAGPLNIRNAKVGSNQIGCHIEDNGDQFIKCFSLGIQSRYIRCQHKPDIFLVVMAGCNGESFLRVHGLFSLKRKTMAQFAAYYPQVLSKTLSQFSWAILAISFSL